MGKRDVTGSGVPAASDVVGGGLSAADSKPVATPSPGTKTPPPSVASLLAEDQEVTRTLADYIVRARPEDVPTPVKMECVRSLLNWFGCAVGGATHPTVDVTLSALNEFSGPRVASIVGRAEKMDALHAALVNGISSHVLDYDDTHLETIIHPAEPVTPAILALTERQGVTGADFIHAMVLGIETECRIGLAVYPSHYDVGWHITGSAGVFGAAAASGKLLGLTTQQMVWALGIAATQSSGFREMFGTMCKPFHPGRAAQNGMTAALLAAKNFTSSERGIEAKRSFGNVMASERDYSRIVDGLGDSFEVSKNAYKPFACGIVIHPSIDACLQFREADGVRAEDVEALTLRVHPLVIELTGKKTPQLGLEGKFSVYHSAAVALIYGAAGPKQYTDEVVTDPRVIDLRDRVSAVVDESIHEDRVHARITLKDGRVLEKYIEHAVGSIERPMSNDALEVKFRDMADGVLSASQTNRLVDMCWNVLSTNDVGAIAKASSTA